MFNFYIPRLCYVETWEIVFGTFLYNIWAYSTVCVWIWTRDAVIPAAITTIDLLSKVHNVGLDMMDTRYILAAAITANSLKQSEGIRILLFDQ